MEKSSIVAWSCLTHYPLLQFTFNKFFFYTNFYLFFPPQKNLLFIFIKYKHTCAKLVAINLFQIHWLLSIRGVLLSHWWQLFVNKTHAFALWDTCGHCFLNCSFTPFFQAIFLKFKVIVNWFYNVEIIIMILNWYFKKPSFY